MTWWRKSEAQSVRERMLGEHDEHLKYKARKKEKEKDGERKREGGKEVGTEKQR